jgi:hypothetical protein
MTSTAKEAVNVDNSIVDLSFLRGVVPWDRLRFKEQRENTLFLGL